MTWENVIDARIVLTSKRVKLAREISTVVGINQEFCSRTCVLTDFYRFSRNFQRSTKNE